MLFDLNVVNMMMDLGLVFGIGIYEIIVLCFGWLDFIDLYDKIVIDYGCGLGILVIVVVFLGVDKVYCVDNDL